MNATKGWKTLVSTVYSILIIINWLIKLREVIFALVFISFTVLSTIIYFAWCYLHNQKVSYQYMRVFFYSTQCINQFLLVCHKVYRTMAVSKKKKKIIKTKNNIIRQCTYPIMLTRSWTNVHIRQCTLNLISVASKVSK